MITSSKLVKIGHSPDPDDAFMFYALAKQCIPMHGFQVEHVIEGIEELNERAMAAELEVTAVSCHAYAYLSDRYLILRSGASVGNQYGPILVSKNDDGRTNEDFSKAAKKIRGRKIAIPGRLTTAHLMMRLFEKDFEAIYVPFDQVFDFVLSGQVDFGLVIHEGQITYGQQKLQKTIDLGKWWFEKTKLPIPLGIDVIRRDLGEAAIKSFAELFRASIDYALHHRQDALAYALQYGRGIEPSMCDRFIEMYVNDFTIDLGSEGEKALQRLFDEGYHAKILPNRIEVSSVLAK